MHETGSERERGQGERETRTQWTNESTHTQTLTTRIAWDRLYAVSFIMARANIF